MSDTFVDCAYKNGKMYSRLLLICIIYLAYDFDFSYLRHFNSSTCMFFSVFCSLCLSSCLYFLMLYIFVCAAQNAQCPCDVINDNNFKSR